jgi:hypothetical protein
MFSCVHTNTIRYRFQKFHSGERFRKVTFLVIVFIVFVYVICYSHLKCFVFRLFFFFFFFAIFRKFLGYIHKRYSINCNDLSSTRWLTLTDNNMVLGSSLESHRFLFIALVTTFLYVVQKFECFNFLWFWVVLFSCVWLWNRLLWHVVRQLGW